MRGQNQSIEGIVARLGEIVDETKAENSALGYFAAVYRRVTLQVKFDIDDGLFDDSALMRRFVVIFANHYLTAYDKFRGGGTPVKAWTLAFAAAQQWWPTVLQHLLLSMNAHINLDLGIAAARAAPRGRIGDLKGGFDRINAVLADQVEEVLEALARISPLLGVLNKSLGRADELLINFRMEKARAAAWRVAQQLAPLDRAAQARKIASLDEEVTTFGRRIRCPRFAGRWAMRMVRLDERGTVSSRVAILEAAASSPRPRTSCT